MNDAAAATVGQRVHHLVATRDGGNASAAARRCGIPQPTMSRLLRDTGTRGPGALEKVARAYNVSIDWLLTGVEAPQPRIPASSDEVLEYGDGPAHELVRWLEMPETRGQYSLQDRIELAYSLAAKRSFSAAQFMVVDTWRDRALTLELGGDDASRE